MRLNKFNIQFFGGGGDSYQVPKRNPEPEGLVNLRNALVDKITPSIEMFNADDWNKARNISNQALNLQLGLNKQIPEYLNQNDALLNEMMSVVRSGNVPSALTDAANASVNKGLKTGMGSMLSGLANRGVLNSSITSQGINNLAQQAADAMNANYLNAYNSVINGYGQGLQGRLSNTNALLSGINALGNIPNQAYSGVTAGIMPAFNMWKAWQNSYDSREDYDTVVEQGK